MHIPDGFLSGEAAAVGWAVGATGLAVCASRANIEEEEEKLPVAGLTAAFFLVADAPFFPLTLGTQGHLLGGTLAVILLGPWLGGLTAAVVVAMQALILGDGGLTTLGINIINMALIPAFVGYPLIAFGRRWIPKTPTALAVLCGFAAFVSIMLATTVFVAEVKLAAQVPINSDALSATMYGTYALVGLVEGVLTAVIVRALLETRRDLVAVATPQFRSRRERVRLEEEGSA